jgi:formamidopyrimidine-DNA glycosylase
VPELPEVEVVRRGLETWVTGRTIESVVVLNPRAIRRHVAGPDDFRARLAGRRVAAARRRGKYLWLPLAGPDSDQADPAGPAGPARPADPADPADPAGADQADEVLLAHLGMSGQMLVDDAGQTPDRHLRVRFSFADGGPDLCFVDQRTFGHLLVTGSIDGMPTPIAHIAPDPLDDAFDGEQFFRTLRRRHTGIKRALLDQSLISGVGNIYADEALWQARLHWARPTETLTRAQVQAILDGVRAVMASALAAGGTSFDSLYVNVNGESGYFERSLEVYGREDKPCDRCGTPIRRDAFMNRSSYSCPRCQPRPRRARL